MNPGIFGLGGLLIMTLVWWRSSSTSSVEGDILQELHWSGSYYSQSADSARAIANVARNYGGYGWQALAQALIANAYAESDLNPGAKGDGGLSYGLFQLHTTRGAGLEAIQAGIPKERLLDAHTNADFFIRRVVLPNSHVQAARTEGAAALTWAICVYCERPTNATAKAAQRQAMLYTLFSNVF